MSASKKASTVSTRRKATPRQAPKATPAQAQSRPKPQKQRKRPAKKQKQPMNLLAKIKQAFKIAFITCICLIVTLIALSFTPLFTIETVDMPATQHIAQDDLMRLAQVPEGANLINVNPFQIEANLKKNPWVQSVTITRDFPHMLHITVQEQTIAAYVVLSSGSAVWALSSQDTWIEPVQVDTSSQNVSQATIQLAMQSGGVVIDNSPASVSPKATAMCTDATILACLQYQHEFQKDLVEQIIEYNAVSLEEITAELKSGVQLILGAPDQANIKSSVIVELLNKYPNQLVSINVRNPAKPTYKKVSSNSMMPGTGVQ